MGNTAPETQITPQSEASVRREVNAQTALNGFLMTRDALFDLCASDSDLTDTTAEDIASLRTTLLESGAVLATLSYNSDPQLASTLLSTGIANNNLIDLRAQLYAKAETLADSSPIKEAMIKTATEIEAHEHDMFDSIHTLIEKEEQKLHTMAEIAMRDAVGQETYDRLKTYATDELIDHRNHLALKLLYHLSEGQEIGKEQLTALGEEAKESLLDTIDKVNRLAHKDISPVSFVKKILAEGRTTGKTSFAERLAQEAETRVAARGA